MSTINPFDILAVRNVISRYCEALDSKEFMILKDVFTYDVSADYPFNSDLRGVTAVAKAIENRLGPIRTHHNLTTQRIVFEETGRAAHATTYFQGVHFGQGPHEGKVICAYGRYIDDLVLEEGRDDDCEGVSGASGRWRITKRKVIFTQRIGDEKIMSEY